MLTAQSLIWCVLHREDSVDRTVYSLAATFLGRMCISGDVADLSDAQKEILRKAVSFYKKLDNVIINGVTHIYGNLGRNTRYPEGTQVVLRRTDDEILVVCHSFDNPCGKIEVEIPKGFRICSTFNAKSIELSDDKIVINKMGDFTAEACLLNQGGEL